MAGKHEVQAAESLRQREFEFTDQDFRVLSALAGRHAGIHMSEAKRELIYGRLARRLRQLGMQRFEQYCELLATGDVEEIEHFTNAITTNLTSFFRENHHFEFLSTQLVPEWVQNTGKSSSAPLRIWCAGCSTGEEPYSVAMSVLGSFQSVPARRLEIIATDLDSDVLRTASNGVYEMDRVSELDQRMLKRWFLRGKSGKAGKVKIVPELRARILFLQNNMVFEEVPPGGPFDLIFCRNVVIYFTREVQDALYNKFAGALKNDGHLFVGHSESLFRKTERFKLVGQSIYRKVS
jgi:chemotaxis protein methyltransferase CheR